MPNLHDHLKDKGMPEDRIAPPEEVYIDKQVNIYNAGSNQRNKEWIEWLKSIRVDEDKLFIVATKVFKGGVGAGAKNALYGLKRSLAKSISQSPEIFVKEE